ncbi:MAG: hypothetical protein IPK26_31945 [Planctomycetes bacterium]|nr:hypothetical protein [Planctomycetota bacterium]
MLKAINRATTAGAAIAARRPATRRRNHRRQAMLRRSLGTATARPWSSPKTSRRFLAGQRVAARRIGPVRRLVRACGRRPLLTLLVTAVLGLLAGTLVLQHGRHQEQLARALSEAERWLALAATSRDEQERPRTAPERREFALAAVSAASEVIDRDPQFAIAWFVRAKAHHRLRQFAEALFDLDQAERLRGETDPEILHFRIDALRQQGGRDATRRMQDDLTRLLQLDPGPHTRALVAEHLLEMAEHADAIERTAALATAREILLPVDADEARTGVALARILEIEGAIDEALAAMRSLADRHRGNVYVHLQAAAMYERAGLGADSAREQEQARLLEPGPPQSRTPAIELQDWDRSSTMSAA